MNNLIKLALISCLLAVCACNKGLSVSSIEGNWYSVSQEHFFDGEKICTVDSYSADGKEHNYVPFYVDNLRFFDDNTVSDGWCMYKYKIEDGKIVVMNVGAMHGEDVVLGKDGEYLVYMKIVENCAGCHTLCSNNTTPGYDGNNNHTFKCVVTYAKGVRPQ